MIKLVNIQKIKNNISVLKNINIEIKDNSVVALLGPERSGKSTLLKIIANRDNSYTGEKIFDKTKKYGMVFDKNEKNVNTSVFNYIDFYMDCYGVEVYDKENYINELLKKYKLLIYKNVNFDTLNNNIKKIISIVRYIAAKVDVLILDDPLKGVNQKSKDLIKEIIKDNISNMTVIYTEERDFDMEDLCTDIIIINDGFIIKSGTKKEILNSAGDDIKMELKINSSIDDAIPILKEEALVKNVMVENDRIYIYMDGDEKNIYDVLKRLIENNIEVYSYKRDIGTIEQIIENINENYKNRVVEEERF